MMATQTPNSGAAQNVIRTNLSSLHNSLRVAQILSVPAGYSQMKKDSVQAVFIQRCANYISLRGSVTNYPNTIGSVQRLPDDIGLVQHSNHVNDVHEVQPLGSIPRLCSSARPNSFNQLARLTPSFCASKSNCSFRSGVMRIWNGGAFPVPFGCLSRLMIVDMCTPINVVLFSIGVHTNTYVPIKTTPRCAETLPRRLTTNDRTSIEVAMKDHITPVTGRNSLTPNIVFTWRFAECQENKATYHHVTAHTEDEARSLLPGLLLVFAARIRQGVNHV